MGKSLDLGVARENTRCFTTPNSRDEQKEEEEIGCKDGVSCIRTSFVDLYIYLVFRYSAYVSTSFNDSCFVWWRSILLWRRRMYIYLISLLPDVREQRLFITLWKFLGMDGRWSSKKKIFNNRIFVESTTCCTSRMDTWGGWPSRGTPKCPHRYHCTQTPSVCKN